MLFSSISTPVFLLSRSLKGGRWSWVDHKHAHEQGKRDLHTYDIVRAILYVLQKTGDESAELWHDEIQACVDHSNKHAADTTQLAQGLVAINQTIDRGEQNACLSALRDPGVGVRGVVPECSDTYLQSLREAKQAKVDAGMWNNVVSVVLYREI